MGTGGAHVSPRHRCLGDPDRRPARPAIPHQPRWRHSRDPGLIAGRRVERPPTGLGGGPGTSRGAGPRQPVGSARGKSRRWPGPPRATRGIARRIRRSRTRPSPAQGPRRGQSVGDLAREQADAEERTGRGQAHAEDLVASTEDDHQGDPGDGEEERDGGREGQGAVKTRHPDRQGNPQARHGRTLGQDRRDYQQDARPPPGWDRRRDRHEAGQEGHPGDHAVMGQPFSQDEATGRERRGQQHLEAAPGPVLGQRGRREQAEQEQADGGLEAVERAGPERRPPRAAARALHDGQDAEDQRPRDVPSVSVARPSAAGGRLTPPVAWMRSPATGPGALSAPVGRSRTIKLATSSD